MAIARVWRREAAAGQSSRELSSSPVAVKTAQHNNAEKQHATTLTFIFFCFRWIEHGGFLADGTKLPGTGTCQHRKRKRNFRNVDA